MVKKITGFILSVSLIIFPFYAVYELYFLDKVYFLSPIDCKERGIVIRSDSYGSGEFLARRSGSRKHNGLDLQADVGTPVYAVRGGRVIKAGFHRGMGNYVKISHPGGYSSTYGHLSRIDVKNGQKVLQADKIGEVGKTGNANYRGLVAHLHLEFRLNGRPQDPAMFLE